MATNANGVAQPAGSDGFDPQGDMVLTVGSLHGRISILAANATARAALTSTCGWAPTATEPLVVLQTDTHDIWLYNGTAWFRPGRAVFGGSERAYVGTNPPAGTEIITQSFRFTGTTVGAGGQLTVTLPTAFANGLCGFIVGPTSGAATASGYAPGFLLSSGSALCLAAGGSAVGAGTSVGVSAIAWGW